MTVSASFENDCPVILKSEVEADPAIVIDAELTPNTTPKPFIDAISF